MNIFTQTLHLCIILFIGILFTPYKVKAEEHLNWLGKVRVQTGMEQDEFIADEPIALHLKAVNLNAEPIFIWDYNGWYFKLSAKDIKQEQLQDKYPTQISLKSFSVMIPASGHFDDVIYINQYVDFPEPGEYEITYEGYLYFQEYAQSPGNSARTMRPVSGTAKVKIRNGSDSELESRLKKYLEFLKSEDSKIRNQGVRAFEASGNHVATRLLRETLETAASDQQGYTLTDAVRALGRIGTPEAFTALFNLAKESENGSVRREAILGIRSFHVDTEKATRALTELLSDQDADIRIAALRGLKSVGNKSCIPQVEQLLDDPDEQIREEAAKTLHKLVQEN